MGGSLASPNFQPLINVISHMIDHPLSQKYPLREVESQMLLNSTLLKVMLGSSHSSKAFG